jgi:hypothetical protein
MKEEIILTIKDLVMDFIYYDRKEDEDLGINAIQTAIKDGLISSEQIVKEFAICLKEGLGE